MPFVYLKRAIPQAFQQSGMVRFPFVSGQRKQGLHRTARKRTKGRNAEAQEKNFEGSETIS